MEAFKNKKYIGLALLVLSLAVWLMVKSNLEKKASRAILDSPVSDYIEYEDISVGLFDQSVTLYEVTSLEDDTAKLEELTLRGLDQWVEWQDDEASFPSEVSVEFSGLTLNLREMLENKSLSLRYSNPSPLAKLARFGYQLIEADGELLVLFDEDDRELSLVFNTDLDAVTELDVEIHLAQVRENQLRDVFLDAGKVDSLYGLIRLWAKVQEDMKKVALSHFAIGLDDDGLIAKMKSFQAVEAMTLPGDKADELFGKEAKKKLASQLESIGLAKSFSTDFSNQFAEFIEDEGDISVATDMDKPIRLAKLVSIRGGSKTLKRLQLSVD